ncbi:MAG: hypothetical protein ACFFAV_13050 [Candidatus Hermodarchaeota archaeon]
MMAKNQYNLFFIGFLSLIIVLLAPYGFHIDLGPGPNNLMAILWEYWTLSIIRWFTVLEYVPYYFFRFITIYYLIRYILDKASLKKTIIMGIINELIPLIISIPAVLILNQDGENYIPIVIPIPTLLVFHLSVVYTFYYLKKR